MRPSAESASGLFRFGDGGKTWTEITEEANKGFPTKPFGRIAVAVAPSNDEIVYAIVESDRLRRCIVPMTAGRRGTSATRAR